MRWYYSDTGKYSGEDVSGSDSVDVQEQGSYEEKIDTFAVYSAFHFYSDCMFSFLYQLDFESNKKETQEKAYSIKESKKQE